ncbi:chitin-binding protein [Amantichitinum ursilacus]|nr:chitin-binding protein [Amantichitinum ursilacus]
MSNIIAGVMTGHLVQTYYPGIQFNKDFLYGSILGQLLQENIETGLYKATGDLIDPSADQQAVMGQGQGGPYQINNYAADMVSGGYAPAGHSLINYVALQKNIGYSMADAATQYTKVTPPSFNNKYYGPMLTGYFHYNDFVALVETGKGTGGWTTPWQPAFDQALVTFKTLPNNFFDVLLNVAYNQGFYGPLMSSYSKLGATATASTVTTVNDFSSVWGKTDTYAQYPYQVRYYLDQLYGNPIPTTSATTLVTPNNHVAFNLTQLQTVFANVFGTLSYVDSTGKAAFIPAATSRAAFDTARAQVSVPADATLDLSKASDRAQIFSILEGAINNLETTLGQKFNATTLSQL